MVGWSKSSENKPFRDGSYCKRLWVGKRTVKQGECAAIWDDKGTCTLVVGPRRVWAFFSTIRFLTFHRAGKQEYIVVKYKDGRQENLPGPRTMFENPVEHDSVDVKSATQVNNSEALVIYRDCRATAGANTGNVSAAQETGLLSSVVESKDVRSDHSISRRVLYGPALFVPHADEWVHHFTWTCMLGGFSGSDSDADARNDGSEPLQAARPRGTSGAVETKRKFSKLQLNTQAMHYTVTRVRTSDEASLDISLVVCYLLIDIEKMLDATSDPMRDISQALTADVTKFGTGCSLEGLLEKSSGLSDLANFPTLCARSVEVGFKICSVTYRWYSVSHELEKMLDQTITSRHKHRLQQEELEAEQQLQTLRLESEMALSAQQNAREQQKKELALSLQEQQDKFDASKRRLQHEQQLAMQAEAFHQRMGLAGKQDQATVAALVGLKEIGIDLNRYLEILATSRGKVVVQKEEGGRNAGGADEVFVRHGKGCIADLPGVSSSSVPLSS